MPPALLLAICVAQGSACVTVYDPQGALQRPVAVDITRPNFQGAQIHVRCISNDQLPAGDAEGLCRRVATLFRNQGAESTTEVARGPRYSPAELDEQPDLIIELDSKLLHRESNGALTVISAFTLSLIPAVEEETFEQGVVVRDPNGLVLASDRGRARFILFTGAGIWSVNWLLDVTVREDEDELTGDQAKKHFSRDFYSLVSQLAFNALVRQRLMATNGPKVNIPAPEKPAAPLEPPPPLGPAPGGP